MASGSIQIKTMTMSLALVIATELTGWWVVRLAGIPPLMAVGLVRAIQISVIAWTVCNWEGGLEAIGWAASSWPTGLKKGALWSMGFAAAAGSAMLVIYVTGNDPIRMIKAQMPTGRLELSLFFLVGGFIGPVAEEVFFRGILYTYFRRWGIVLALVASTTIFVALHSIHGIPITQIIGGIVFAIAYETSGNLMVPITIHCLGNAAIFSLSLF